MTTDMQEVLRRAYAAFNDRDVEAAVALMSHDVAWPDATGGGFVHGRDGVRRHWREQFDASDPHIEPTGFVDLPDGRVGVTVRQVVRSLDGNPIADERLLHAYSFRDERIHRMEIVEQPDAG
jgi:hypothetical protein